MNIKTTLYTLAACFLITAGIAQEKYLKNADEARALSKKAVEFFNVGNVDEAFKSIKPYWPLPENEIDMLSGKTLSSLNMVKSRFGVTRGFIKIREDSISDIAIREIYLLKYDFHALRFIFTYYRSSKGWIVNAFLWDDKYTEEFK